MAIEKANDSTEVPKGQDLTPGRWYRITELDPADFAPSLHVGDVVLCAAERAGCIDPVNRQSDGMGTQWFADLSSDEDVGFQTLVNGVELVEGP
jgi:hypothetical protein